MDYSIEEVRAIVRPIAEKHGVAKVYLFGSRARGDSNPGSDYDFSIETGSISDLYDLFDFKSDLEEALGSAVDVISRRSAPERLRKLMSEDEVIVYD